MREGWEEVKLSDISTLITKGTTPSTYGFNFEPNGEINFIRAEGISKDGYVDETTFLKINHDCHQKLKRSQLKENDILFSIAGMALGKTGLVKKKYLPANTNQAVALIRLDKKAEPKFILYYFIEPNFYKLVNTYSGQAAQPNINLSQLGGLPINLPPLLTQQKIAEILSAYDDLIENNLRRIQILEEMAQQTYEEWFVRMRYPGYENDTINPETGLPEGWEIVKCINAMDVLSGGTPKTSVGEYWDGEIDFYTPKDAITNSYTDGTEKTITETGLNKCNSKLYPKDTVFITARGTVGKLNLANKPMAMNQSCYALIGKKRVSQFFLFESMKSVVKRLIGASTGGVFDTITVKTFEFTEYVIPSINLINQFEKIAEGLFNGINNLLIQNHRLRESRDLLLPRLMMGLADAEEILG